MSTTVLLIDDHQLIRQGLAQAFKRSGDFLVVGEAGTVSDGMRLARETLPDVVITDVQLPDGTGLDFARALRADNDRVGIVVLTMHAGDDALLAALNAGASAFVSKEAPSDDVVAAARHAATSPRLFAAKDLTGALRRRNEPTGPTLSTRETEVLTLLSEGHGVSTIAGRLFISESTAKTHIAKIYEKLGAANRAQAIMRGVQANLLQSH